MILIKHSPSYQISHLYRLLYRKSIDDFFHSQGLYRSLDYLVYGTTYYKGGVIAIEVDLVTEKAKKLAKKIKNLEIATDHTAIGIGFLLLLLEQKRIIAAPGGIDKIKEALDDLHKQPWQDMDSLEMIDMRSSDAKGGALILQKGMPPRARTLTVAFSLNQNITTTRPELAPLFEYLVRFFDQNTWTAISMKYGVLSEGMNKPLDKKGEFTIPFSFKVHPQAHETMNQLETLDEIVFDFLGSIYRYYIENIIHRYIDTLNHNTYSSDPRRLLPGPGVVTDTGFLVGTQGWRKIATMENCELLLDNATITVKYGRKRVHQHVL